MQQNQFKVKNKKSKIALLNLKLMIIHIFILHNKIKTKIKAKIKIKIIKVKNVFQDFTKMPKEKTKNLINQNKKSKIINYPLTEDHILLTLTKKVKKCLATSQYMKDYFK